jgi:hypothetical protein
MSSPTAPGYRHRLASKFRRLTAKLRVLPRFLIIGAQRSGTTSLYNWLSQHPDIRPARRKEVHYFDLKSEKSLDWYRAHFPARPAIEWARARTGRNVITGEASPYYLFHPAVPHRVRQALPQVKLIVLLRDPVARAISHYHKERRKGREELSMRDAFERESHRLDPERPEIGETGAHQHKSYVSRGRYAEQLERWFGLFPREQFLIAKSEDVFADPASFFDRVADFVGVASYDGVDFQAQNAAAYQSPDVRLMNELYEYFKPYNERLSNLLGRDFHWGVNQPENGS